MNYLDYKNARDAAWRILIDCDVRRMPVDIIGICRRLGVKVRLYEPDDQNDGVSFFIGNTPIILVNSKVSPQRQRFTAAHELGHILLGHVGKYELQNREPDKSDNPIEQAANVFAARLLAPACVLWGCKAFNAEQIEGLCDISHQAAAIRAERMKLLCERGRFLSSQLERKLYAQFKDFIEEALRNPPQEADLQRS